MYDPFSFFLKFKFYLYAYFACMYVCIPHEYLMLPEAREDVGSPRTRITNGCKLACGCQKSNLGPLEEQPVSLTAKPYICL